MITLKDVSKSYGRAIVVDGVNLDIPTGGLTSIIGPNGAGKSTLLSMIARLLAPTEGHIFIDGLDVAKTPSDALARRISILRQDNHTTARLTVHDLVSFGRYPHSKGRYTIEDKTHIDRAIRYLALDDLRDRYLDEPLNNLDMKHAVAMMKLMRQAADELGKTVIIVIHDINFASCYSDDIIVMQDGKLAYQGAPIEVVTPDIMREIYDIDVKIHQIAGQLISVYYD